MTRFADLILDADHDHAGQHRPIHAPGFAAYCPVCGIGCESAEEADKCCYALRPKTSGFRRTGLESRYGG